MAKIPSFLRTTWPFSLFADSDESSSPETHRRARPRSRRPFERLEDRSMLAVTVDPSTANFDANDPDIVIVGTDFSEIVSDNSVSFRDTSGAVVASGTVVASTTTSLTVEFNGALEAGDLFAIVTVDGADSGTQVQVANVVPVVTAGSVSVAANASPFEIVIAGSGFDTTHTNNTVELTNGFTGVVTGATATTLTVDVTGSATSVAGDLTARVTTNSNVGTAFVKVGTVRPVVTLASTASLASANTLTLAGFGFDLTPANNTVLFSNGAVGTVEATGLTETSMTVSFASGTKPSAGDLTAIVTSNGIVSGAAVKVAEVSPVVTLSTSSLAANSTQLTIAGVGFSTTASNNTVTFSNGVGSVVAATATSLTVVFSTPPTTFGSLTATVTSNGIAGTATQVADIVPSVTANSALRLPVNATSITINGFGFDGTTAGENVIEFDNGAVGTVIATGLSTTSLTVTITTRPTVAGPLRARVKIGSGGTFGEYSQVASVTPIVSANAGNNILANADEFFIIGSGFSTTASENTVVFSSGAVGRITTATATRLTVEFDGVNDVKPTAGNLTAVVTTNGVNNGTGVQVARVRPVVTTSSTAMAADATSLTISGVGFDPTAANNSVSFNNGATGTVTAATKTSLTVSLTAQPSTSGNLTATVTVNGTANTAPVNVASITPVITSSTTSISVDGSEVSISGFGFGSVAGNNLVTFDNGAIGAVTASTATSLTVTLSKKPTTAGTLNVASFTSSGIAGNTNVQVATVRPVVTADTVYQISASGTSVIINGLGFSTTNTDNTVTFDNGAVGTVSSSTATSMTVNLSTKPTSAGDLTAVVTTLGVSSSAAVKVATVAPVVTSNTTVLDVNANTVEISGFGFDPTALNNTVVLSSGTGTVTAATATSLTVTFDTKPSTVGSLTAVVTSNSISSGAAVGVANIIPAVTTSSASLAINAAEVVIAGVGFSSTASNNTVVFNNGAVGTVSVASGTSLTVALTVKPTSVGDLTAQVFTNGNSVGTTAVKVATVVPVVTAAATSLAADGTLEINGFGFDTTLANNTVEFSSGIGTVTAATPNKLTVSFAASTVGNTPATAGDLTVVVTVGVVASGTAIKVAEVKPVVTASTQNLPASATTLTINGYGFSTTPASNVVTFNSSSGAVGTVTAATATTLTVTLDTPPTEAGVLTAIVTTSGAASGTHVPVALAAPSVTESTSALGINASTIEIDGTRFDTTITNNTVVFNNGAVGTVTNATVTKLTVNLTTKPSAVGDLTAVVTVNGQTSGTATKVASVIPVVTTSSAVIAANGTLTINGFGFDGSTISNNTVVLSNGTGTVTAATATTLTVTFDIKPAAGDLTATVEVGDPASTTPLPTSSSATVASIRPVVTTGADDLAAGASTMTINGFGFDAATPGNNVVTFSNGSGTVTAATATSLTVTFSTSPTTVGSLTASVTTGGVASGSQIQVATVKPTITSSTAELGINASTIVINGFGFGSTIALNKVTFNNNAVGVVTAASTTQLTVTFTTKPTSLGDLTATVTANSVVGAADITVATISPVVSPSTVDQLATAETVTISGFGFDTTPGNNVVVFNNGAIGAVTAATATSLTVSFTTKPKAGNLTASVAVNGVSNAPIQVASVKPVVTSSTTNVAANATTLVINGFGFDTTPGQNSVDLDLGAVGSVTAATATTLTVTLSTPPTSLGDLTAIVTTNSKASGVAGVQVGGVVPGVTLNNTAVSLTANTFLISGAGFDSATAGNNLVTFNNGAEGLVTEATATTLTVTFGTGKKPTAGNLTAVVSVNGTSSGDPVKVATVVPSVTQSTTTVLAPDANSVVINGSGFSTTAANNTVVFSGGAIGTVTTATATRLTVTLTKRPVAGNLTARVTTNGVQNASAVQIARVSPKVTSSTARLGLNGTSLLIRGFGFDPTAANNTVVFAGAGGATGTVTAATLNTLTVTFTTTGRPKTAGDLTAIVTTNSRTSGTAIKVATVAAAVTTPVVVTASTTSRAASVTSTLTITGTGFSTTPSNNVVTFNNGAVGTVTASTATSLTVTFATLPKAGNLTAIVATNGVVSGTTAVQVASITPVVTSSTADLAANATTLTINGFGFDTVASNNRLVFTNGAVGRVTAATANTLTVQIQTRPTSVGNLNVTVTTNTKSSGSVQVAAVKPTVTSSTAAVGIAATTMVINGFGFSATANSNVVTFDNGATGTVTAVNTARTQLTVTFDTAPSALGSLSASVSVGGTASGDAVQVGTVAPTVTETTTSVSPSVSTITITGVGFSTTVANNVVTFNNGAAGVVTAANATSLTVALSSKPSAGDLTAIVTTNGFSSGTGVKVAEVTMGVTSSTELVDLSETTVTLTINGTGFSSTPENNVVTLSSGQGVVTAATPTSLTVTFSAFPYAGDLTASVTTNGLSSGNPVQVGTVNPFIQTSETSFSQTGTVLTINGRGFDPAETHTIVLDRGAVGTVSSVSSNGVLTVSLTTLPTSLGSLTAVVTSNGRTTGSPVEVATVVTATAAPVVTSSTATRLASSTATLTIAGTGFSETLSNNLVTFNNGAVGTVTSATATSLTVTLSTRPKAGNLTAVVTTNGVPSGTAVQVARVTPVITSTSTSVVSNATQRTITITGVGFDTTPGNNTVTFNNGNTGTVTAATATSLTVRLNARPTAGPLNAIVRTNSVASGTTAVQVARIAPTVTASTTSRSRTLTTIEINGFGFSTTAANNTVVFNNGAVGRVTAATATKLTVTFSVRPAAIGSLTARVTTNTLASGSVGVQVATMT